MAMVSGARRHTAPRRSSAGCTARGDSGVATGFRKRMHLGSVALAQRAALQERHTDDLALLLHTPLRCLAEAARCPHLSGASTSPSPSPAAVIPPPKSSCSPEFALEQPLEKDFPAKRFLCQATARNKLSCHHGQHFVVCCLPTPLKTPLGCVNG